MAERFQFEIIYLFILILTFTDALAQAKRNTDEQTADYWIKVGQERLMLELERQNKETRLRDKVAKNVILFIGDGMGMSTITATRILKNQRAGGLGEEKQLSFEDFPHIGIARTYEVDYQVSEI